MTPAIFKFLLFFFSFVTRAVWWRTVVSFLLCERCMRLVLLRVGLGWYRLSMLSFFLSLGGWCASRLALCRYICLSFVAVAGLGKKAVCLSGGKNVMLT